MKSLVRTFLILSFPVLVAACSASSETRVCTYNGVVVSCSDFDQMTAGKGTSGDTSSSGGKGTSGDVSSSGDSAPSGLAQCVVYVTRNLISQTDAERLCSRSTSLGYCVADSVRSISQSDAERLCSESTALAQCVVETVRAVSQVDAERLCRK